SLLNWISLVGCFFIAYLAVDALKHALRNEPEFVGTPVQSGTRHSGLVTGFLVGISNPNDIFFFVSFCPQFIHVTQSFKGSIAVLSVLWIIIDLSILFAYIFLMRQKLAMKYKRKIELVSSIT
ncbi:LysE family translocator, partial [Pseudomonas viridiflava]|uniref:LysE family translocator n=1 Tax=Pseudomonas viridiflava TaxID=33069 RepID=UPI0013E0088A